MKNLTDDELVELMDLQVDRIDKNLSINKLIAFLLIIEAIFFIGNVISISNYLMVVLPCWGIYLFHYFRYKKAIKTLENLVDEYKKRYEL
jgi:hypothetical protein